MLPHKFIRMWFKPIRLLWRHPEKWSLITAVFQVHVYQQQVDLPTMIRLAPITNK